ncbi:MBL fold metallo-hydrolase [Salinimonas marina]|uniref:MBL fold metallo-hydrolase n=1 Tax=Salinimonas marina TaxID=2785918 RepID=A0A7S9HBY1_9ALTE|nr:MBL fold metallo-hydrolase [Salinimonas marina]QPG04549.1 MBL fold metallo-hydrolase [Salinimonas marina]
MIKVEPFYDENTGTGSYVVYDDTSRAALIIDAVLHFDVASGRLEFDLAKQQLQFIKTQNLQLHYICETHAHADHLSAAAYLRQHSQARTVISEGIGEVQQQFSMRFNKPVTEDQTQLYDILVNDGDTLMLGKHTLKVMATPGHTPDSVSYLIGGHIFVGDTLFMPDVGTARCDFPGGDAHQLYQSIQRIHALPDETRIWVCHDYPLAGRSVQLYTNVKISRNENVHVNPTINEAEFVALRTQRDATLKVPRLLYPALQVNLWGALLPDQEAGGQRFIKIPLIVDEDSYVTQ